MRPVKVEIFTARAYSLIPNMIAWITAPARWIFRGDLKHVPSHAGLIFTFPSGKRVVAESHYPEGFTIKPLSTLDEWLARGRRRWIRRRALSLSMAECADVFERSERWILDHQGETRNTYSLRQIFQMWAWRRLGRRVKPSPDADVCSEMVARMLFPFYDLRVWEGRPPVGFDEVTPFRCQEVPLVRLDEIIKQNGA